ncbi:MAG: GSCFA domain-containing protein [Saonia sp.]
MKLQTNIPFSKASFPIDYGSQLFLLGSCFSENIGKKLDYYKFPSLCNPFGILFHPKAIERIITDATEEKRYTEKDVFFQNERWHSFDAHSNLSDVSKDTLLEKLNDGLDAIHRQISKATHIIITLGTAWVYRHIRTGSVVTNCHKVPQKEFKKELLSIDEIVKSLENSIRSIYSVNKNAQFIFTVSPVRHLKDGFIENQRSKAHLISAIHQVINGRNASYFPSYELLMDELRDYRFYEVDMVHPNALAIAYIWEKFKTEWISEKAYSVMEQVEAIQKGIQHKAFHPESEQHRKFLKSLQEKIAYLKRAHPFMEFNE